MKDSWSLLEDSLLGDKESYIKLMQEAIPSIFEYFYTIYGCNQTLAIEETSLVLDKSFTQLSNRNQKKSFLEWILSDLSNIKKQNLISELKEEASLNKFTLIYAKEIFAYRFTFEFLQPFEYTKEEVEKAKFIIDSCDKMQANDLADCIRKITHKYNSSNRLRVHLSKNIFLYVFISAGVLLIVSSIYFWQAKFPQSKKVDFSKLKLIQPPLTVIFEDIYKKEISWEDDPIDEMPEKKEEVILDKKPDDAIASNLKVEVKVQTVKPEKVKQEAKPETKNEKPEDVTPVEVKKEEKPIQVEVKKEIAPIENEEPKKENALPEEKEEPEVEQEIVVLNQKEIPLIAKGLTKAEEGAIQIGDDKEKYELKDFKDKKVIFYSFLEVKDVEKAKDEAFKILAKFGYKGEVLKREKDYIVLTATFPGKENHDRMIKKFSGLGTLYVGNDVSEFLELYKKELDKERSFFFPKYKPEDLPKEVTVNLYVFPLQKK